MITTTQEKEIEQCLLSKKLNPALFLEIKDHFIQQISALMENKSINFQEAFLQTRLSWKKELEMVNVDLFSFKKISRIEKRILQMRFRNIALFALTSSLLLSIFMMVNPNVFMYLQISVLSVLVLLLIHNFIFRKMRLYNYVQLSFHPLILKNALAGLVLFSIIYFFSDFTIANMGLMKFFFLYAMISKIQLLYFNAKKINVLV